MCMAAFQLGHCRIRRRVDQGECIRSGPVLERRPDFCPGLPVFNLFRHAADDPLCCAVSQCRPVPAFIQDERWAYVGTIDEGGNPPFGFQSEAARSADRWVGFYLFCCFGLRRS